MIRDVDLTKERLRVFMELPWVLPASMLMEFTDADLDNLAASQPDEYWSILNEIVHRIEGDTS